MTASHTLRSAPPFKTCLIIAAGWKSVMVRLSGSACDMNSAGYGMTPEGKVKAMVKRRLAELGDCYSFMPVQNGMGAPSLDLINCYRGSFFTIETKVPGKHLTPRQKITAKAMRAAGARVYVVRDEADADYMVKTLQADWGRNSGFIYDTLWTDAC